MNDLKIGTIWTWEHWLDDILINAWVERNLCVLEGRNYILSAALAGGTQISAWYVVPFEDNHTPASGDNYATPGFTECILYDETTRPGWQSGSVVAAVVNNSSNKASFSYNASKTIYGAALVGGGTDPETKNDQAGGGVLFCESKFLSPEGVINGSVLKVTVEITLSAA
jgi:hypothetical protein